MTIGSRDSLKRLTYRREVIAAARSLGLRSVLRK
jgi:hypothetical protein